MLADRLSKCCCECVDEFAKQFNALDVENYEDNKYSVWSVVFKILRVEFVYVKKEYNLCPRSSLYTRIYLNKNDSMFYHIHELIEFIDERDFRCYYFSYIESEERMRNCFNVFVEFYAKHMERLKEMIVDAAFFEFLKKKKTDEMSRVFNVKATEKDALLRDDITWIYEYNVILFRYTRYMGYTEYLAGNYKKALSFYEKILSSGKATDYEKRLAEHIKSIESEGDSPLSKECASCLEVRDYNGNISDGITYLKNFGLCYILFAIIFFVIEMVVKTVLNKGVIYSTMAPMGSSLMIAVLPAIFGSFAFRRKLAHITRKRDVNKALAFDELLNGRKINVVLGAVFAIFFVISLGFHLWLPFLSVRFYDGYIMYNEGSRFMSFESDRAEYEDIESVCYVTGRNNVYGDYIDRGSYVIVFKDGSKLDLDGFTSVDSTQKHILPILGISAKDVKQFRIIEEYE